MFKIEEYRSNIKFAYLTNSTRKKSRSLNALGKNIEMRSIFCYSISAKNKDIFFLKANISCIFLQTCMLEHKASNFAFAVGLRTMMNFMAYNFTKCNVKRYCNHPNEKENYNFNNIKQIKLVCFVVSLHDDVWKCIFFVKVFLP